ncbi:MAG: Cell surface protein [Ignavibacteriae bacterium]|nr:MAG: Cell surface protein [Ignavibacteriota bacterium]
MNRRSFIQLLVGGIIIVLNFQVLFSQGIIEKRESSQIKILDKNIIRDYIDEHFLPPHLREKYSRRYKATEKLNGTEEKHSHYPERPLEKHSRDTDLGEDFFPPQLRYKFDFPESNSRTVKKQDFFDAGEDLLSSQTSDTFATAWVAHYASGLAPSIDYATDIAVDASGNIYVTGYSDSLLVGYDFLTIKYNNLGVQQWVARYNGPWNYYDEAKAIAVDGSGNVYVTGKSNISSGSIYTTIKYVQKTVNIEPEKYLIPSSYNLEQNYPNPFNPITTIKYQLPVESKVSLNIYNVLGQEVKTLVDEVQETGFKSVEWNSTDNSGNFVSSGVYFYRMDARSITEPGKTFTQIKKMIILK